MIKIKNLCEFFRILMIISFRRVATRNDWRKNVAIFISFQNSFVHALFVCLVLYFAFCSVGYTQVGDVSISNGSAMETNVAENYTHISSVNSGITYQGGDRVTPDYSVGTGVLSSFLYSSSDIFFTNVIPVDGSTATMTTQTIGITVNTLQGNVRQIKYRIMQDLNQDIVRDTPYKVVYSSWDAGVQVGNTIAVSVLTSNELRPGVNYIQWFAQNTVDLADSGKKDQIFTLYVNNNERDLKILQPIQVAAKNPIIKAEVYSAYGFSESSVTIKMFSGESTAAIPISVESGIGKFKDKDGKRFLEYKYTTASLVNEQKYTLLIVFTDNKGEFKSNSVTFTANTDPVAQLLPYPSPYNPNLGKPMKIKYVLSEDASVTINIYDRAGKFVSKAVSNERGFEGSNYAEWNSKGYSGDNLANGIYICEIIADSGKENRRYRSFAILRK
jgi:hypothetical protein